MALVEVKVPITGVVWKIEAKVGDKVVKDDTLVILESMKTEIPILATEDGVVKEIKLQEGEPAMEEDVAVILEV